MKPDFSKIQRNIPSSTKDGWKRMAQCERQEPFDDVFFKKFINTLTEADFRLYPDQSGLKSKIAKYHNLNENNIIITAGSDLAIKLIFDYYANDYVVSTQFHFPMYDVYAKQNGASLINEWGQHKHKYVDLVALANPNSPTGEYRQFTEITDILESGKPTLIDEAYIDYVQDPDNLLPLIHQYPNLMITRSFSKGLGGAGARLGYILANDKTIEKLSVLEDHYAVSTVSLKFGEYVLDNIKQVRHYRDEVLMQMHYLANVLLGKDIQIFGSHGNWMHIEQTPEILKFFDERKIEVKTACVLPDKDLLWVRVTLGDAVLYELEDL